MLDEEHKWELEKEYESDEIWRALRSMGSLKPPGPDGFPASFLQRTCGVIGPTLISFVKHVLKKRELPSTTNESLLVLIPEEDKPSSIKGFRPISLCNVCIKLVTKLIVNRLKGVLGHMITPNQGAFVPGRQRIDNMIICQELVHSFNTPLQEKGEW